MAICPTCGEQHFAASKGFCPCCKAKTQGRSMTTLEMAMMNKSFQEKYALKTKAAKQKPTSSQTKTRPRKRKPEASTAQRKTVYCLRAGRPFPDGTCGKFNFCRISDGCEKLFS